MFNSYTINTLQYNPAECIGCGMCAAVCPHGVFEIKNRQAVIVRQSSCMECGACQLNCPAMAIKVESGVGCASAMIRASLLGKKEATCGESKETTCGSSPKTACDKS